MADFVLSEWVLAPYPGDQAPPHVHHRSDEAFIVLEGELEVLVGDQRRVLTAGEFALVPAGSVHTFATHGAVPSRILVVMTPEIQALIAALHDAEPGSDQAAVWARYNASVVPAP